MTIDAPEPGWRIEHIGCRGKFELSYAPAIGAEEKKSPVGSFKQAFAAMMADVRKGQYIQRYKGLGEMNPEQHWKTTLDSNTRRLLQVKIEDAIAADEVFNSLIGDPVEPRRDFIERNALEVSNLDN